NNLFGTFSRTSAGAWILFACGVLCAPGCQSLTEGPLWSELAPSPYKADRHLSRAIDKYREGKLEQALESARRAREADPGLTTAAQLEAQLYADLGHRDDYVEALRRLIAESPQSPHVQCAVGRLLISADQRAA